MQVHTVRTKITNEFCSKIWKIKGNISAELCYNLCVAGITCCADEPIRFHVPGTTGSFSLDNLICASCAKGVSVQKKAQPVKAGVAKLNGPKRKTFFRMAAGCHRYFVTLFAELCAAKGVFYLETEEPFCVANSHFKKNQPSVLLGKE